MLDQDAALRSLREATAGADDGELFLERRRSEVLAFDDGRLRTASYDASEGFGLRAVRGETAGYAHSTSIDEAALTPRRRDRAARRGRRRRHAGRRRRRAHQPPALRRGRPDGRRELSR